MASQGGTHGADSGAGKHFISTRVYHSLPLAYAHTRPLTLAITENSLHIASEDKFREGIVFAEGCQAW